MQDIIAATYLIQNNKVFQTPKISVHGLYFAHYALLPLTFQLNEIRAPLLPLKSVIMVGKNHASL